MHVCSHLPLDHWFCRIARHMLYVSCLNNNRQLYCITYTYTVNHFIIYRIGRNLKIMSNNPT